MSSDTGMYLRTAGLALEVHTTTSHSDHKM